MRSRLTLAVAVAVGASILAACGSGGSATPAASAAAGGSATPAASAAASAAAGGSAGAGGGTATGKNITLMVGVKGDPFYVSMECGAREAATAAGATLNVQGPDKFDATLQNPMLDAVAAAKPDALLVAPNDVKASVGPLKNIQDAGTKVVLVDTVVDDPSIGVSRIATNNELGGEKAAEALATLGLGKGAKVLVISTDPGVSSVDARVAGFGKKATELGFTQVSDTQYSHNQAATRRAGRQRRPRQGPRPRRRLRHEPVHRTGRRDRRQAGRQVRQGQDRRVRRRSRPDQAARGRRRPGSRCPEAVRHRPAGREQAVAALNGSPSPRRSDRVPGRHQGQHGRSRRSQVHLQVQLLSLARVRPSFVYDAVRTHPHTRAPTSTAVRWALVHNGLAEHLIRLPT